MKATVELKKGKVRWFYRVVASNGQITLSSQKYYSKSNAKREAMKAAHNLNMNFKEDN